jgi:N-methylhydantoinase B
VIIRTGSGGGWGNPLDRDPARVLDDVRSGFVSRESAERDYGVIIDERLRAVDMAATQALREQRHRSAAE